MSDEPENLVLVYLRRLDAKMDSMIFEIRDVKERVNSLELGLANIRRDIADLYASQAGMQLRMDRIEVRLERIERRLDLQEAHG